MNLTKQQIQENQDRFLQLISQIDIPGADTEGLVNYLLSSDFFTAPASTQYHCNFEGGNCFHSLHVYETLDELCERYFPGKYSKNSKLICGLLHDISKANFYEKEIRNKKIYSEKGSKSDNQGKYDWFAEEGYRVKEAKDRELYGEHQVASMLIISQYIPLSLEETLAITYHHCGMNDGSQFRDLTSYLNKYSLLTLLHIADVISTFVLEKD